MLTLEKIIHKNLPEIKRDIWYFKILTYQETIIVLNSYAPKKEHHNIQTKMGSSKVGNGTG